MMKKKDTPMDYITDGLIFHLDGIDKGGTANAWTDLVSGMVLTGTATFSDNGVTFDGVNVLHSDTELPQDSAEPLFTVEICCSDVSTKGIVFASRTHIPVTAVCVNLSTGQFFNANAVNSIPSAVIPQTFTCSVNATSRLLNGMLVTGYGNMNAWSNGGTNVGGRKWPNSNTNGIIGTVHSIRVYNRRLTEEEMLHNQVIDMKRFNLNI